MWVITPFFLEKARGLSPLIGQCCMNVYSALNIVVVVCSHLVHLTPLLEKGGGGGVGLIVSTSGTSMVAISFKAIPSTSSVAMFWGTSFGGGSSCIIDLHPLPLFLFCNKRFLIIDIYFDMAATLDSIKSTLAPMVATLSSIDPSTKIQQLTTW